MGTLLRLVAGCPTGLYIVADAQRYDVNRRTREIFQRITVDSGQMDGVPCVRGLRIPVATVLRLLARGLVETQILADYPDLEREDIRECLRYAAASVTERELPLPPAA